VSVTRRDLLLALGCGAVAVGALLALPLLDDGSATVAEPGEPGWWAVVATLVAQSLLLLGVRERPRRVLVGTAALGVVAALAGAGDAVSLAFLAVVVAAYVASTGRPVRELWPPLGAAAVLVALANGLGARSAGDPVGVVVGGAILQAVGTLGLTLLVALVVSTRRESARARRAELDAVRREHEALVQAAIARERTAMARELHDIAAHHLSGIAVMTAAIDAQIDTDPAGARAAVRQVREQSTAVLRDLRSLVGLLREDGDTGTAADPRPETLGGIAALVADAAAAGRDVGLSVLSDRPVVGEGVGPLAQLACYRAVQEALANAARHAPGAACRVQIDDRAPEAVLVTVRNDPAAPPASDTGGGYGLVGMRERAELTGASLDVGPTDDGGWQVAIRVPREEQP
jgi:signal transduction histidine kinase